MRRTLSPLSQLRWLSIIWKGMRRSTPYRSWLMYMGWPYCLGWEVSSLVSLKLPLKPSFRECWPIVDADEIVEGWNEVCKKADEALEEAESNLYISVNDQLHWCGAFPAYNFGLSYGGGKGVCFSIPCFVSLSNSWMALETRHSKEWTSQHPHSSGAKMWVMGSLTHVEERPEAHCLLSYQWWRDSQADGEW